MDTAEMKTMLKKAEGDLATAEEELKEKQALVNALRQLVHSLRCLTGNTEAAAMPVIRPLLPIKESIVEVLNEAKEPLTGPRIAAVLADRGHVDVKPHTVQTMLSTLSRDKDGAVIKVKGRGFEIKH